MTFLNPWPALVAAAVAVPLLLVLYFLKLRRQALRMPSTLLWRSSTEDLQANVPFQRLRWSVLLLLQLLLLATLLAALARPVLQTGHGGASRMILLIDHSASMNAPDGNDPTTPDYSRLDAARDAAREVVRRLGRRNEPAELMVVGFGATPRVLCGFESNRRLLLNAIDAIEPTDEAADLDAALQLAGAFAVRADTAQATAPDVVLFSDGGVGRPQAQGSRSGSGFLLPVGALRFVGVGPSPDSAVDNVGIVAFSARRDYRDPGRVLIFARLANAGPSPIETAVTLRVDGSPAETRALSIPAATTLGPGEAAYTGTQEIPGAAVLSLTCNRRDELAADNTAALVVRPPTTPRIGVVHAEPDPDRFLIGLLEAMQPRRLVILPAPDDNPAAWPGWSRDAFDLVVFDRVSPAQMPPVPTLTFGAAPPGVTERDPNSLDAARILSWDRLHPVMRHVSLDGLVYSGFSGYDLPETWTALAYGPQGPVITSRTAGGDRHVAVGFDLTQSNWPMDVSITVFLQNVFDHLLLAAGEAALSFLPGEPVVVRSGAETHELVVEGPTSITVQTQPGSETTLPPLRRVGLYGVRGAVAPMDRIAVNMLSDQESDIRPLRSLRVNAGDTQAGAVGDAAPLELWPILAAVAVGLLLLEWIVYCGRIRAG
jgi:hypothetical protein